MKTILQHKWKPFFWLAGGFLAYFTLQMFHIVAQYTSWAWDVDFLLTKQHIIHFLHYRIAFYGHIFSSLIVLGSGLFLFSNYVLKKWPQVHRWLGKTYVALVLLISAPTGMIMAWYANGGWAAQMSFLILSALWWWFTYKGFATVRKKQFKVHRIWMMRSYALSLSAVTLRIAQMVLGQYFLFDPEIQYIIISWGSWLLNLAIVETIIFKQTHFPRVKGALAFSK